MRHSTQPAQQDNERFTDNTIEIKMGFKQLEKLYKFTKSQFEDIKRRFAKYADPKTNTMDLKGFKLSMGLLGMGEAEYLSQRIFNVITQDSTVRIYPHLNHFLPHPFNILDFIKFLSQLIQGSDNEKAKLSFRFIDKNRKGSISYEDFAAVVCEISFLWNYLTGEKAVPQTSHIENLCARLGIKGQNSQITLEEYKLKFDTEFFSWFDFFNNKLQQPDLIENKLRDFNLRQMEQTLNIFTDEIFDIIQDLKDCGDNISFSMEDCLSQQQQRQIKTLKGPLYIDVHTTPLRGDSEEYISTPTLSFPNILQQISKPNWSIGEPDSFLTGVAARLQKLHDLGKKVLFSGVTGGSNRATLIESHRDSNILLANGEETKQMFQQRKTTIRNKGKVSTKNRNYVYPGHENWNLIINMMLGIRRSIRSHYALEEIQRQPASKSSIHNNDSRIFRKNSHLEEEYGSKYTYQLIDKRDEKEDKEFSYTFVDYSPKIFFEIRLLSGITNESYLRSIGPENLIGSLVMGRLATLTQQVSTGKSGSFFYYTEDSRFLVKTISKEEHHLLKAILPKYHAFMRENPQTTMMRIYGLHKLKNRKNTEIHYFIVVNNIFSWPLEIDLRYDLKGSTHGRKAKNQQWDKSIALKDLDLIKNEEGTVFNMSSADKSRIFGQIKMDIHFFSLNNIIDYSLLVGIHKVKDPALVSQFSSDPSVQKYLQIQFKFLSPQFKGVFSKTGKQIYFFGLIDILTEYNTKKMFESTFKGVIARGSSCLPPLDYQKRFQDFIYTNVFNR